jgi:AFG3 family protein
LIGKRPFEKETTYQAFTNKKEAPKTPELIADQEESKSETSSDPLETEPIPAPNPENKID